MANFIFPRRALQQNIDQLNTFLSPEQLGSIVGRMNLIHADRIPAMWELVVLHALSQCGELRHEAPLESGRCPDFELNVKSDAGNRLSIVGDITCVSDKGLSRNNPVDALSKAVHRTVTAAGLDARRFGVEIGGFRDGPVGNSRIKLRLPPEHDVEQRLRRAIGAWLETIQTSPKSRTQVDWHDEDTRVTITYDPSQPYFSGNYPSYTGANSRSKHPLFTALKAKARQLRGVGEDKLSMIVACDGGCDLLGLHSSSAYGTYTAAEVTGDFLRQNTRIHAVLLIAVNEKVSATLKDSSHGVAHELVFSESPRNKDVLTSDAGSAIETLSISTVSALPPPVQTASNASLRSQESGIGPDGIGGYTMTDDSVTLSSRALQRLLAGEISIEQFVELHGWAGSSLPNPFARMMKKGRMIASVDVSPVVNKDDDSITILFGVPDAAAAPFKVPPKQ